MKKLVLAATCVLCATLACNKPSTTPVTKVSSTDVITDFVQKVALPQYAGLQNSSTTLNTAIITLNTNPTNTNLALARQAWRNTMAAWEQCEGFLIGPVEDNSYGPDIDTWPVDYHQLDSFTSHSLVFDVTTVHSLGRTLRGFHPLEYILWGKCSNATIDSISPDQKQYMVSLAQDLLNSVESLNASWAAGGGNFQAQLLNAGKGSTRYVTEQVAILAIVAGMSDICDGVANYKLLGPYNLNDSNKTESSFSHNSVNDFINNITGAQNVYLCSFGGQTGTSLSSMVAVRNVTLDNKIKQQFTAALNALNNISVSFELGIYTHRTELQAAMTTINTLHGTLVGDLKIFVQDYVR